MLTLDKTIAPSLKINLGEKRKTPEKQVNLSKNIIFHQELLLDMKVSSLTTLWKNSPKEFFFDRISQIISRGILFCSKVFIYPLNFISTIRMKLWHPCQKKTPFVRTSFTRSTNKHLIKNASSVESDCRFDKSVANFPRNVQNFF